MRQIAGPSGQMNWIRDGPKCLGARNITEAIDSRIHTACSAKLLILEWLRAVAMRGSTCWPTAHLQWVYFQGSILASNGGPPNTQVKSFSGGRYSEGESRYNLTRSTLKAATMDTYEEGY
ncbi:uncharacterized protein LOC111314195 isoform X2 [Durio zibethinus]|uniref:Uncharacterized protein LOC111314195 isoform X2 n=1 Tax=Durio zibethinus TaxID=66656 RepID=A0A6P6B1J6_DURZI|nr:uncharacterized protein LOC111314195 isoform X2 [Durio zibethinus]